MLTIQKKTDYFRTRDEATVYKELVQKRFSTLKRLGEHENRFGRPMHSEEESDRASILQSHIIAKTLLGSALDDSLESHYLFETFFTRSKKPDLKMFVKMGGNMEAATKLVREVMIFLEYFNNHAKAQGVNAPDTENPRYIRGFGSAVLYFRSWLSNFNLSD